MTDRPPRPGSDGKDGFQPSNPLASAMADTSAMADKLLLLEEGVEISKRETVADTIRVSTRMETRQEVADVVLDRDIVDVTRVPVGRVVEMAPAVRTDDDTTIVPVVEERFVVVKQLFLLEEIHIRRRVERETAHVPVELRRQVAMVQRIDPLGHVTHVSESNPERPDQAINLGESHGHS